MAFAVSLQVQKLERTQRQATKLKSCLSPQLPTTRVDCALCPYYLFAIVMSIWIWYFFTKLLMVWLILNLHSYQVSDPRDQLSDHRLFLYIWMLSSKLVILICKSCSIFCKTKCIDFHWVKKNWLRVILLLVFHSTQLTWTQSLLFSRTKYASSTHP